MSERKDRPASEEIGRSDEIDEARATEPRLDSEPTPATTDPAPETAADTKPAAEPAPEEEPVREPPEAARTPAPVASDRATDKPSGRAATVLAVLALLLALGAAAAAYYLWSNLEAIQSRQEAAFEKMQSQQASTLEATQSRLESTIDSRGASLEQNLSRETGAMRQALGTVEAEQKALRERQEELQTALRNTLSRMGQRREGWLAAEAGYLLRIAAQRLELARDPATARAALEAADMRLRETGDSAFVPVRQSIANQLRALAAVEVPDVAGMSAQLSSLAGSVEGLPLRGEFATPSQAPTADAGERPPVDLTSAEGWRGLAARLWEDIRGLVTIRHDGASTKPLLPPEHRYYLRQNLRLQLEQAQLALLRGEPSVYGQSLEQAEAWTREYYAVDTQPVASLLETLQQLAGRPVEAELPDISEPVRVLERVREKLREESRAAAQGQGGGGQ